MEEEGEEKTKMLRNMYSGEFTNDCIRGYRRVRFYSILILFANVNRYQ